MSKAVAVKPSIYKRYMRYANVYNKPVEKVIHSALKEWMDTEGDSILECYFERHAQKGAKTATA